MSDIDSFRIDLLKIKRKVFGLYPVNSEGRKALLRMEKLKELQELVHISTSVPPLLNLANKLEDNNRKIHTAHVVLDIVFIITSFWLYRWTKSHSGPVWLQAFDLGFLFYLLFDLGSHIREIILNQMTIRKVKKQYKEMQDRVDQLQKEVDEP